MSKFQKLITILFCAGMFLAFQPSGYVQAQSCPDGDPGVTCTDNDGDGYASDVDCNDSNPAINPGAEDICSDGIDQDCSGKDRTKGKGCKKAGVRPEGKGKTCSDGIDNDNDGWIDCDDIYDPDGSLGGCSSNRVCR